MSQVRILAFAGSSRQGSLNQAILRQGVAAARAAGAEVEQLDLRALELPLFDADLERERGLPAGARKLKQAMRGAQGFLIASPEYNSGLTPLLLNALDWASRVEGPGEPMLAAYAGKVAGLIAASPGQLGGLRGLFALRELLLNVGVAVVPELAATGGLKDDAFDAEGKLIDPKRQQAIESVAKRLVATAGALAAAPTGGAR